MRLNGVEKKELLDAGLSIVEERGLDKLSIRSASTRVRVSTQPFYSYFMSIDAFRTGVLEYIAEHPEDSALEIARALGISRTTVYKYIGTPAYVRAAKIEQPVEDEYERMRRERLEKYMESQESLEE